MVYLDYNATTPVATEVLDKMLPYFSEKFGNASSSTHPFGWKAKEAVDISRSIIAQSLGCIDEEITFTSGATESINTVLKGIFNLYHTKGKHIITSKTEHNAVLDTCEFLKKKGADITYLDVDKNGIINIEDLKNAIRKDTILVAIMYVNNETGIIQNIKEISNITHQNKSIFFCDATQAYGKLPINVDDLGIDALCISGHKIYGPKGIGILYLRRKNPRVIVEPLMHGGHHERGVRSGTINVPSIVGIGKAAELAYKNLANNHLKIEQLRNYLEDGLKGIFKEKIQIIGEQANRIFNTSSVIFPMRSEHIIRHIKNDIAVSVGSACSSDKNLPSHVLTAMGYKKEEALSSIRFSLGNDTTKEEIDFVLEQFSTINY